MQPTFMSHIVGQRVKGQSISKIIDVRRNDAGIAALAPLWRRDAQHLCQPHPPSKSAWKCAAIFTGKSRPFLLKNSDRLQPSSIITRITNDVTQIQNFINGSMRIMMKAPITRIGAIALIILRHRNRFP